MPTRQAAAVTRALLHALGADADLPAWAPAARQEERAAPVSLDGFVGQLATAAAHAETTLLAREAAALADLVRAGTFPLIVVAVAPDGERFQAAVLTARDGDGVTGTLIRPDGVEQPVRGSISALPPAERVLVPVRVTPTVGSASDGRHPGVALAAAASGSPDARADGYVPGGLTGGEAAFGAGAHSGAAAAAHGAAGLRPSARLWMLLARERRDILLVFGYATLAGLFSLALPLSVQQVVQLVSGRMLLQPTYLLVGFVLLGTAGVGVLQLAQLSVVETIQQRIFARVALEFSFRVPRLRYDVALREDLPEVMNRFFETVTIQKSLAKLLLDLSTALLTTVFGLILLTLYHPYFTVLGVALVLALALLFRLTGEKGLATSIQESKYKYKVVHWLEEMARANSAFKFAGRSPLPIARADELVSGYLKYRKAHFRVLVHQMVGLVAFRTLIVGTLLILGIALVTRNQISLGQFVASEIVIVTVLAGVEKLVSSLETVYDMLTGVDKLGHVTDLPLERGGTLELPARPVARAGGGVALEVSNLTFRYAPGTAPVLDGCTLAVSPGELFGITGYEGSGQSTLLRLLGGLLDGYEGAIAIDNVPLRNLDRTAYRGSIGQLLSPYDLFDGTVEENVGVGRPDVSAHDVLTALDAVGLSRWLREQPFGLNTRVTNGGRALPAHVVARLLVAQAIAGRPRLVIVDDYYQNVEPDCRQDIVRCLTDRSRGWTLVLVSHDPVFLAACDRVAVLADGRVAREDSFARLAEQSAFVRRLVDRTAIPQR